MAFDMSGPQFGSNGQESKVAAEPGHSDSPLLCTLSNPSSHGNSRSASHSRLPIVSEALDQIPRSLSVYLSSQC